MQVGSINSRKVWKMYMIMWAIIAVAHILILYLSYHVDLSAAITESIFVNGTMALIGAGLWYMVRFTNLHTRGFLEIAFYHLSGIAFVIILWLGASWGFLSLVFSENTVYIDFLRSTVTVRVISGIFFYIALVFVYYLIINFRELKEQKEKEEELTALLRESELNLLRSQIRPHFLFNSLNSISSLTITDPEKAQEMVIKLSEFMRYSLSYPERKTSSLQSELYHTQLYLDIEKVRFGKRLNVKQKIEDDTLSIEVPPMLLQPLLENAVKYGLYESTDVTDILKSAIPMKILPVCIKALVQV